MTDRAHDPSNFRQQRTVGIAGIAAASLLASVLWFGIDYLMSPLPGMDSLDARMLLTLKCWCVAVLFCLVTGVEAVAHERLTSPAFDPLAGFETRRLRVNQRYLQNTVEQIIVFAASLFGLAAYSPDGSAMRAVVATTVVWIAGRAAFWVGYHRSAALRGLGAPGMAVSMIDVTSQGRWGRLCRLLYFSPLKQCCFGGRGRSKMIDSIDSDDPAC
jgi:uncharacterized MAPEG superfamily protein